MSDNRMPPLGIMPERHWREIRVRELVGAICRYLPHLNAHTSKVLERATELRIHISWLAEDSRPAIWSSTNQGDDGEAT